MKVHKIDGRQYHLPNTQNDFQLKMFVHLINWKWDNITTERGVDRNLEYDAILPDRYIGQFATLYPDIREATRQHLECFPFRLHTYFNHMASSQAANINLFLPILLDAHVNEILGKLNPEFNRLATEHLDHSWRIEFWDEPFGTLNDKNATSGTDSDIAIAYYNHDDALCLWLIEHKLTESEFTNCGGYKSKGRQNCHDCTQSFPEILKNKSICYYHDVRNFNYWNITDKNRDFFVNHTKHTQCPFRGGMNQLWRNQLLAMAVEQDDEQPYKHAHFSVVKHHENRYLDASLNAYHELIANNPKFSVLTSAKILEAANACADSELKKWIDWYRTLYNLSGDTLS